MIVTPSVLVLGTYNLVMWYIYGAKIPFFEKYRKADVLLAIFRKSGPGR